jgi:hypothetical protein
LSHVVTPVKGAVNPLGVKLGGGALASDAFKWGATRLDPQKTVERAASIERINWGCCKGGKGYRVTINETNTFKTDTITIIRRMELSPQSEDFLSKRGVNIAQLKQAIETFNSAVMTHELGHSVDLTRYWGEIPRFLTGVGVSCDVREAANLARSALAIDSEQKWADWEKRKKQEVDWRDPAEYPGLIALENNARALLIKPPPGIIEKGGN